MAGTMRVPRTRGVLSGILLVLLGLWGALLPLVGPYFHFGFTPDDTWVYNTDRLQLSIAPGAAAALGGLILLLSANRAVGMFGGWLAALAGAWFAVGPTIATLWNVPGVGAPLGAGEGRHIAEQLAGFTGLGVVIVFLAALALGRFAVVGVRERRLDEPEPPGSNTTQPLIYGRYARENQPGQGPPPTGDQHVAGDTRWDR